MGRETSFSPVDSMTISSTACTNSPRKRRNLMRGDARTAVTDGFIASCSSEGEGRFPPLVVRNSVSQHVRDDPVEIVIEQFAETLHRIGGRIAGVVGMPPLELRVKGFRPLRRDGAEFGLRFDDATLAISQPGLGDTHCC